MGSVSKMISISRFDFLDKNDLQESRVRTSNENGEEGNK
jgi:hypothetical protein